MTHVSIIVPVYNAAHYLGECLDSILNQNVDDMEVIVINDCSIDETADIIFQYANRDKRIKPIHLPKNIGLGFVRNKGIELAQGKWVAWLDSDDIMQPGSLKQLIETGETNKTDIVFGHYNLLIELADGTREIRDTWVPEQFGKVYASNVNFNTFPALLNIPSSCAFVYNRKFLNDNNIRFLRKFHEDHDFMLHVFLEARKISIRADVPYFLYRKDHQIKLHAPSITRRDWDVERFKMMVDHFQRVIVLFDDKKYKTKLKRRASYKKTRYSFFLGEFANNVFPHVLGSRNDSAFKSELERLVQFFKQTKLVESGIDYNSQPIKQAYHYSQVGYYELVLQLILDSQWDILATFVKSKALSIDDITVILAANSRLPNLHEAMAHFIRQEDNAIVDDKSCAHRLIPHTVDDVIVHIGMSKTGSTAIQAFLQKNRDNLSKNGILFPATFFFTNKHNQTRIHGHAGLQRAVRVKANEQVGKLFAEITSYKKIQKVILSTENLCISLSEEEIKVFDQMLGGATKKIIIYLRRQDTWVESGYGEGLSGGSKEKLSFTEHIMKEKDNGWLDHYSIVERWADVFGAENIIVRPYDKGLLKGGVVEDFCQISGIGGNSTYEQITAKDSNISPLAKNDLILLRQLNNLPFKSADEGYRPFAHAFIDKFGSNANPRGITWFKGDERRKLLEECEESNRLISEKYLDGKPLFSPLTKQELNADLVNDDENIAIPAEKLEIALKLYHQFHNKKDLPKSAEKKPHATGQGYAYCYKQGTLCFHKEQFEAAFDFYSKALEQQPENVQLKRVLAESLINLDRKNEAVYHLEKAHKLLPDNKSIKRRLMKIKNPLLFYFQKSKPFPVPKLPDKSN